MRRSFSQKLSSLEQNFTKHVAEQCIAASVVDDSLLQEHTRSPLEHMDASTGSPESDEGDVSILGSIWGLITQTVGSLRQRTSSPKSVAFAVVSLKEFGPVPVDTRIPFEEVYTNDGDGWNTDENFFEAPVTGVYYFTASIHSQWATGAWADIVRLNKQFVGWRKVVSLRALSSGGNTNQVVLHLERGDRVAVQLLPANCRIFSHPDFVYTAFSGFLLNTS